MKRVKGMLLLALLVVWGCFFWGNGEVEAAKPDFFKEYSGEYNTGESYDFKLKYKCRMTIYMEGEETYQEDYDEDYDYDVYGTLYVSLHPDSDSAWQYDYENIFEKEIDITGDYYKKTITLRPGKYSLYISSDDPYYVSMSGEYYPELSSKNLKLVQGKTKTLKVNGTSSKVKWSSSRQSVATVNSKGVVKGKKPGKAVITAKCKGHSLKCNVTVEKKPVPYKTIAKKMKEFAQKNDKITFKNIDVGNKCRLYGRSVGSYTEESVMYNEGYGMYVIYHPYIELVKKSNGKSEIRLRLYGEMYLLNIYNSTSLYCSHFHVTTSNRRMNLKMKNTYSRNAYNYAKGYYEGRMKGYAQISSSLYSQKQDVKKFKTMLGQGSLSVRLKSTSGAYFTIGIPGEERNNWQKLVKEYNTLLKYY